MNTESAPHSRTSVRNDTYHVAFVGSAEEFEDLPIYGGSHSLGSDTIVVERVGSKDFADYLDGLGERALAAAFIMGDGGEEGREVPGPLWLLRHRQDLSTTRAYLLTGSAANAQSSPPDGLDVEEVLDLRRMTAVELKATVENGVRAHRALGTNPLVPQYYLDAKYNEVFDWFETTKWNWSEVDLTKIERSLLTVEDLEILQESAIIEFGTLPGAHNFLREWSDEYSFSSWALSWGAEEARHSLLQSRYLREIGINVKAKHAMYKREPYPMGENRAGTLMMNIISESRAAEYYKTLSDLTREPVLKKIWRLLGRDESRHARAFFVFCKELCNLSGENTVAALEMAYVWLADRSQGVKHPAGFFYPHSTSTRGLRRIEKYAPVMTDASDRKVLAMIRNILDLPSLASVRDLKSELRARVA